MSRLPTEQTDRRSTQSRALDTKRRRFLAAVGGVGATLLAGCAGSPIPGSETEQTGMFRLLVSDRPGDIADFDSLTVTFDRGRLFHADADEDGGEATSTPEPTDGNETATESPAGNETASPTTNTTATESPAGNETTSPTTNTTTTDGNATVTEGNATATESAEDEHKGWSIIDLSGESADLTQLVGEKAQPIFEGQLPAGRYTKLELYVADVEGIVDGEEVDVSVPSGKLQLTKSFEVDESGTTSFVFDIVVVEKGTGSYNLRPVVSESGVAGEDVTVTEVPTTTGGTETAGDETGTVEESPTTAPNETTNNTTG